MRQAVADGLGQRERIAGRNETSRAASVQDLARAAGAIGRENRQAAGEGFQQNAREPLVL